MKFLILAASLILAACSSDYIPGDVVDERPDEIHIAVGYDAANEGINTRAQAAEHCAETDRKAMWLGHDRNGNLVYRCNE